MTYEISEYLVKSGPTKKNFHENAHLDPDPNKWRKRILELGLPFRKKILSESDLKRV
jgi:hypothetical protein